jgi:antitoxin component YwqK of YwqJK toxin-antitoxin module
MRNICMILALILTTGMTFGQKIKKDTYIQKGDLIEATLYHENGAVAQTGFYNQENKLTGEWISYDTLGNKLAVGHYVNGEKTGTWYFYQGNEIKEVSYMNSKVAKVKSWKSGETRIVSNR